jgi:uncharacterized membrane protein
MAKLPLADLAQPCCTSPLMRWTRKCAASSTASTAARSSAATPPKRTCARLGNRLADPVAVGGSWGSIIALSVVLFGWMRLSLRAELDILRLHHKIDITVLGWLAAIEQKIDRLANRAPAA